MYLLEPSLIFFTILMLLIHNVGGVKKSLTSSRVATDGRYNAAVLQSEINQEPLFDSFESTRNQYSSGTIDQKEQMKALWINAVLKKSSQSSIALIFLCLVWRSLIAYELADQFTSKIVRYFTVAPVIGLLVANVMGFVINLVSPTKKNQLKAILALATVREFVEVLYNIFMMITTGSKSTIPREVYLGRFFMCLWWIVLCQSAAKSRWVLTFSEPSPVASVESSSDEGNSQRQAFDKRSHF